MHWTLAGFIHILADMTNQVIYTFSLLLSELRKMADLHKTITFEKNSNIKESPDMFGTWFLYFGK